MIARLRRERRYPIHSLCEVLACTILFRALRDHTPPTIHQSDQGVQYAATKCADLLEAHQVQTSMAEGSEARQNGYVKRLIRTIKGEEVTLSEYED
jgi:transposase InsO family protein